MTPFRAKPRRSRVAATRWVAPASLQSEPVLAEQGIAAAFLRDGTLRRGDIVVFPDGPRVFNGSRRSPRHHMDDFEGLKDSAPVSDETRDRIIAATAAGPADETVLSFTAKPSNRLSARSDGAR